MALVLIDWLSPSTHAEFNRNLYSSLKNDFHLYIYNEDLANLEGDCLIHTKSPSRFLHALRVLKICWKHRKDTILFVTYDDLYAWIAQFFVNAIFSFEHKTTPERPLLDKHALWQRLLFFKMCRLCQSKAQESVLKKMGQRCKWVGLPIGQVEIHKQQETVGTFLMVSELINIELAQIVSNILYGKIKIKKSVKNPEKLSFTGVSIVELVDRFHFPEDLLAAEAFVLLTDSPVRGSGWFTEAVKFGIPLVLVTPAQQRVFEGTYPGFPYVKGDIIKTQVELRNEFAKIREFKIIRYVDSYMNDFNNRLVELLGVENQESRC